MQTKPDKGGRDAIPPGSRQFLPWAWPAWLDPEGRDRVGQQLGPGSGKLGSPSPFPAQGKHFEQTPQLWPPPLISTSEKLPRGTGKKRQVAPWSDTSAGLLTGIPMPLPYYSLLG